MRLISVLFLLVIHSPVAKASWFGDLCARALGRTVQKDAAEVHRVEESLILEVHRRNSYSSQHFELSEVDQLDEIQGGPPTALAELLLSSTHDWIVPVSVLVFANPNYLKMSWEDHGTDLGKVPALLVLFEDVQVRNGDGKEALLSELISAEAQRIKRRSPEVQIKLYFKPVSEFKELDFSAKAQGKTVMWVQGSIDNNELKAVTLLSAQAAFEQVAHDSRFAILKKTSAEKMGTQTSRPGRPAPSFH